MLGTSLASLQASRLDRSCDVSVLMQSFANVHTWSLKTCFSLHTHGSDLTATPRRPHSSLIDVLATAEVLLTLTTRGICTLRHLDSPLQTMDLNQRNEQILYLIQGENEVYFVSTHGNNGFVTFSKASYSDLRTSIPYRPEIFRETTIKFDQILQVDKFNCEIVLKTLNFIEIMSLIDGKIKRKIAIPSEISKFAYDNGTVTYSENNKNAVLLHIIDVNSHEVKINLRNVSEIDMLEVVADYVLFKVGNSPLVAVNYRTGERVDCPKTTRKVLGVKGESPMLVDEVEGIQRLGCPKAGVKLSPGSEYLWIKPLNSLLVYGGNRRNIDILHLHDMSLVGSIPVTPGEKVRLCAFCEETFEVVVVMQRGSIEVWH